LTIRQVEPGAVKIGDEMVMENVLIFRDEIQRGIAIDEVATLSERELDDLLQLKPEIVILGTGWQAHRPPQELVFAMARRGIGFESMDTPAACRTFNILLSEGRDVAAILVIGE
jgi:uncharacterized protein